MRKPGAGQIDRLGMRGKAPAFGVVAGPQKARSPQLALKEDLRVEPGQEDSRVGFRCRCPSLACAARDRPAGVCANNSPVMDRNPGLNQEMCDTSNLVRFIRVPLGAALLFQDSRILGSDCARVLMVFRTSPGRLHHRILVRGIVSAADIVMAHRSLLAA